MSLRVRLSKKIRGKNLYNHLSPFLNHHLFVDVSDCSEQGGVMRESIPPSFAYGKRLSRRACNILAYLPLPFCTRYILFPISQKNDGPSEATIGVHARWASALCSKKDNTEAIRSAQGIATGFSHIALRVFFTFRYLCPLPNGALQ